MNIRPTQPGQTPAASADRLRDARPSAPSTPDDRPGLAPDGARADRAEVSTAARQLHDRLAPGSAARELPPERLAQILDRLSEGHYDRPDVRDAVLNRLAGDLGIDPLER